MTGVEMTNVHADSVLISSDNIVEIAPNADNSNGESQVEPSSEFYEGTDFASFEDAKNYYTRGFDLKSMQKLQHMKQANNNQYANGKKIGNATCSANNNIRNNMTTTQGITEQRWRKPAKGSLKCNVDASFSNSRNKVGIGICIRDDK
ncbi:hypothetical protein MTR_4g096920 [Medicago truncatula]|uniref:Uncharacterized protein n=1 Tax=Medicago truncatula TaxID=3880 RepID=G7JE10_MEDTR|nr:hypothetical protein MTR_4g096920 [Medicago truncatula]